MKSTFWIHLLLLTLVSQAEAGIFKCQSARGKTVYQPEPCAKTAKQSVVDVKEMTPEETAQAKEKLRMWQEQQAAEEAAKAAAEEKRREELHKQQARDRERRLQEQQMRPPPPPTGINRRFGYMP